MTQTLELLIAKTHRRLEIVDRHIEELPAGRGGEWKALLRHAHTQFLSNVQASEAQVRAAEIVSGEAFNQTRANVAHHLERVQILLDGLHIPMATYRAAVARSDVPVGLQHLIDDLIEEIVIGGGDPMVHLNELNMYSTEDLTARVNLLIGGLGPQASLYRGRNPIAFNLPGLDPNNVLLAPVLAHEVAHTAVNERLLEDLADLFESSGVITEVDEVVAAYEAADHAGGDTDHLLEIFTSWSRELLCDAIAVAISGPSFLFALAAFLVPPSVARDVSAHPPVHDRVKFALRLTENLGWTDFLSQRTPNVLAWLRSVAEDEVLDGSEEERALRKLADATHDARERVAFEHVENLFSSTEGARSERLDTAATWLSQGVPLVDLDGDALTPWQVILTGWMAAFSIRGDETASIAAAAGDPDYNAVIVKALEYSHIVTAWRAA